MINPEEPDWNKGEDLLPAIVQDADDKTVLMLGYMNKEALKKTQNAGKSRLWMKRRNIKYT